MAVSYASNRVTIGTYKSGDTTAVSTTSLIVTSGAIVSGDIGRFVMVRPSETSSGETQVRRITSVSGGTIGINSPWVGSIPSGTVWRVSHNAEDVHAIGDAALQKIGESSYRWNADWNIQSAGFFADADISLEMQRNNTNSWLIAPGGVVQFGVSYGGEGSARETTNGCRLNFIGLANAQNVYGTNTSNSRLENGPVVNYYGCLIESRSASSWMFQRMQGPTRFIGCMFDGMMGGRFYHEASEWVDCRMSGNNDATPAWSIGATFTRDIDTVFSYRNLVSMKSYLDFGGILRNVTFSNNTDIFSRNGGSGSVFDFIDCTEFDTPDTITSGGVINQSRSVNMVTTDENGSVMSGVAVRINNSSDTTQGEVSTSDANGIVQEILARRYRWEHNSTTRLSFSPFRIRIRKYGYFFSSLNSAIADPIRQSVALIQDSSVTQLEATALAHTGITVVDHGGSPVSWNGKPYGITVTGNLTTNPSLTAEDIKHYLHYHIASTMSFNGKASGLEWHNLIPMSGTSTELGDYGGVSKGVRVVDQDENPFPGIIRMQADDGTFFIPTIQYTLLIEGFESGSDVVLYDPDALSTGDGSNVIQTFDEVDGTSVGYGYTYTPGKTIDVGLFKPGMVPLVISGVTLAAQNSTLPVTQTIDRNYF